MPLLFSRHPFPATTFGLWKITEEEDFFLHEMRLSADEIAEWGPLKGIRRLEWLAGRWLLHHLSGEPQRLPLAKDVFSKPFFPNNQHLLCSLSHSQGVVGAFILDKSAAVFSQNPSITCGCDIQVLVEKMPRLAPKFVRPDELKALSNYNATEQFELQHVLWTAKESLYKAYGIKSLDFRQHLKVEDIAWESGQGTAKGEIQKGDFQQTFKLLFERTELPDSPTALIWAIAVAQ
jgi:4'-phosphopantetheinyl transferase